VGGETKNYEELPNLWEGEQNKLFQKKETSMASGGWNCRADGKTRSPQKLVPPDGVQIRMREGVEKGEGTEKKQSSQKTIRHGLTWIVFIWGDEGCARNAPGGILGCSLGGLPRSG